MTKHHPPLERKAYPRNRKAAIRCTDKWRMKNRQKADAYDAVAYAVHTDRLERRPCELCNTDKHVCAFPENYALPLKKVKWRCRRCNNALRRAAQAAAPTISGEITNEGKAP